MTSTHTGEVYIPRLPLAARQVHLFKELGQSSLLSLGVLCDHGCTAHLDKDKCFITHGGYIILTGTHDFTKRGLWHMKLPPKNIALKAVNNSA